MSVLWRGLVVGALSIALALLVLPRAAQPGEPTAPAAVAPLKAAAAMRYAALGDSYTAGPGIADQNARPAACRRSSRNYPALVAKALGARLVDASCGGARTRDLNGRQRLNDGSRSRAQLRAVDRRTDLVILGMGANEFGLFARIFGACAGRGSCGDVAGLRRDARRVEPQVRRAVRRIAEQAPDARILVVGYPRMLPAGSPCRQVPLNAAKTRQLRTVWARVNTSLRRAAQARNVEYVDPYPASNNHHACSRRPWVNGARVTAGDGTSFHPTPAGMAGMKRLVLGQIRRGP